MIDCCKIFEEIFKENEACFGCKTKAKENNLSFEIVGKNICRIHVDDCLIKTEKTKKCDYVFYVGENNDYFFVELKRPDSSKIAVNQIIETISFFQEKLTISKEKINGVVIHKSIPKSSTIRNNLKEKFVKKHGKSLLFKSKTYSVKT